MKEQFLHIGGRRIQSATAGIQPLREGRLHVTLVRDVGQRDCTAAGSLRKRIGSNAIVKGPPREGSRLRGPNGTDVDAVAAHEVLGKQRRIDALAQVVLLLGCILQSEGQRVGVIGPRHGQAAGPDGRNAYFSGLINRRLCLICGDDAADRINGFEDRPVDVDLHDVIGRGPRRVALQVQQSENQFGIE